MTVSTAPDSSAPLAMSSFVNTKVVGSFRNSLLYSATVSPREEFAPYGYLKAEEIQFTVEDTADIQSVVMKDEVPTGAIIINKDGEFVTDTTLMKGHWYDFIFNYFKDSLAGATFEVYAAEDIVSPDGLDTIHYEFCLSLLMFIPAYTTSVS